MTPVHLQQWIQHPEALNRDTLYELRTLVARYPYFQSLRLLYLKNLYVLHDINFGAELRKAVLYVSDRRVLFYLIEGDRYALHPHTSAHAVGKELEKEPSIDRTLSLIDAFLATVPEEHSQTTELDYAMDYTAYLKYLIYLKLMTDKIIKTCTCDQRLNITDTVQKIVLSAAVQFRQNIIQKQNRRILYFSFHHINFR